MKWAELEQEHPAAGTLALRRTATLASTRRDPGMALVRVWVQRHGWATAGVTPVAPLSGMPRPLPVATDDIITLWRWESGSVHDALAAPNHACPLGYNLNGGFLDMPLSDSDVAS